MDLKSRSIRSQKGKNPVPPAIIITFPGRSYPKRRPLPLEVLSQRSSKASSMIAYDITPTGYFFISNLSLFLSLSAKMGTLIPLVIIVLLLIC